MNAMNNDFYLTLEHNEFSCRYETSIRKAEN